MLRHPPVRIFNPPSSLPPTLSSSQPHPLRAAGRRSFFQPVSGHRPLTSRRVPIPLPDQHSYTEVQSCVSTSQPSELASAWSTSYTARPNHSQQSPLSGHLFHNFQTTASSAAAGLDGGYHSTTPPSNPLPAAALTTTSAPDLSFDFSNDFANSTSSSDDFSFDTTQLPTTCGGLANPSVYQFDNFDLHDAGPGHASTSRVADETEDQQRLTQDTASLGPYSSITALGALADEPLEALAMSASSSEEGTSSSMMSMQYGGDSGTSSAPARPSPTMQPSLHPDAWPTNQPMAGRLRMVRAPTEDDRVRKREKNTAAARKYRQKRTNRIAELEAALAGVTGERDELRMQLLASRTEVRTLKEGLGMRLPAGEQK